MNIWGEGGGQGVRGRETSHSVLKRQTPPPGFTVGSPCRMAQLLALLLLLARPLLSRPAHQVLGESILEGTQDTIREPLAQFPAVIDATAQVR